MKTLEIPQRFLGVPSTSGPQIIETKISPALKCRHVCKVENGGGEVIVNGKGSKPSATG